MSETAQQYVDRILSNVSGEDPWQVLATTPTRLRRLVAGGQPGDLVRKPAPDRWSVAEILAHLADCEVVTGWRLRNILATDGASLQPFDQNVWAAAFNYDRAPAADSLDLFEANRRGNLRLLRAVAPAALEHHGMHAERGRETVAHLIRLNAGHDLNHLRQIEHLLGRS
jgi:DinB superfamily